MSKRNTETFQRWNVSTFLLDLYVLAFVCWLVVWRLLGDINGWLALVNAWAQWLLMTGLPAGAVAVARRGKWWTSFGWMFLAFAIGRGYVRTVRPAPAAGSRRCHNPSRREQAVRGPGPALNLSLLTFNLRNVARPMQPAADLLQEQDADVLLFQEAIQDHAACLRGQLDNYSHHCWLPYPPTNMGLGIVSRFPFAVTGVWNRPSSEPFALRATFALDTGPLDVYCVHFTAPTHQVRRFGPTALLRAREQQIQTVLSEVAQRTNAAVLAGDWNQTGGSDGYRWAEAVLIDGWRQGGKGRGWTWPRTLGLRDGPSVPPLLRLDHIFHTGTTHDVNMEVMDMKRLQETAGSDHAPLLANIRIRAVRSQL